MQLTIKSEIPEIPVYTKVEDITAGKFFLAQGEQDIKRVLYYKCRIFFPIGYFYLIRFVSCGVIQEHRLVCGNLFQNVQYVNVEMILTPES